MGKNDKKEARPQTFKLRIDLVERLDAYRAETGVSKTFAVEKALERYLNEVAPIEGNRG